MIKVSVPAAITLLGDYAVFYGEPAIGLAVNQRLNLEVIPVKDMDFHIVDDFKLDNKKHPQISRAITKLWNTQQTPKYLEFKTQTEISQGAGLNSATPLTLAAVSALLGLKKQPTNLEIAKTVFELEHELYGISNPLEISVAVAGGAIFSDSKKTENFQWALNLEKNKVQWNLHKLDVQEFLIVVGSIKTASKPLEILGKARNYISKNSFAKDLMKELGTLSNLGLAALKKSDLKELGTLMNKTNNILTILGANPPEFQKLADSVKNQCYGVKLISSPTSIGLIALTKTPNEVAEAIKKAGGIAIVLKVSKDKLSISK